MPSMVTSMVDPGFIGSALCNKLLEDGHIPTLVSRNPLAAEKQFTGRIRVIKKAAELAAGDTFDVVINLAGAPVVGLPWTKNRRAVLLASRVNVTADLLQFVRTCIHKPAVWIQASAIGYYGAHAAEAVTETSPRGTGFAAELCSAWEAMTDELEALQIRRVVLRFGLVFGRSGGALPLMMLPFRFCVGAVVGSGKQKVAWVHLTDVVRVINLAMTSPKASGIYNVVAPECPSYATFASALGQVLKRPVFLRIPAFILRTMLGEMASMLVDGPGILPARLLDSGFEFSFPALRPALQELS